MADPALALRNDTYGKYWPAAIRLPSPAEDKRICEFARLHYQVRSTRLMYWQARMSLEPIIQACAPSWWQRLINSSTIPDGSILDHVQRILDAAGRVPFRGPSSAGWYRAMWGGYDEASRRWTCVEVAKAFDEGFCVWDPERRTWVRAHRVQIWGRRIDMPDV